MILVYAEQSNGEFKKSTLEAVTFASQLATATGDRCAALVLGEANDPGQLGVYGASEVFRVKNDHLSVFDSKVYAAAISAAAAKLGANYVVLSHSFQGKSLTGRLAVRMNYGSVPGVKGMAKGDKVLFEKGVYSGKAIARLETSSGKGVISVMGNAIPPQKVGSAVEVSALDVEVPAPAVRLIRSESVSGSVPLPEAEMVVSAGRGMKGPENWGIVEELADTLGAATACSRPVADADWRPHHEHVGQTGIAIRPNLYIAIGISGAIQHLAGVNNSKVIVVINKDPEAPFFKAADYGVVGDLFEVVPRLNEALKAYKHG